MLTRQKHEIEAALALESLWTNDSGNARHCDLLLAVAKSFLMLDLICSVAKRWHLCNRLSSNLAGDLPRRHFWSPNEISIACVSVEPDSV